MKNKFTKKIAKEIADFHFAVLIDIILNIQDDDLGLDTDIEYFEQEFTEDLEERNIIVTPKRIEVINKYYEANVDKAIKAIRNLYPSQYKNKLKEN